MPRIGTRLYCPNCKEWVPCRAVSPTELGKPKARRWYRRDHTDIAWFRRARQCSTCGHKFLTAEAAEILLQELAKLRAELARKHQKLVHSIRRSHPWLERTEDVPRELARRLVSQSAWWLTHSSGSPVRAAGHADRMYLSKRHGWVVDFGANYFLAGRAIERCARRINGFLENASNGMLLDRMEVRRGIYQDIAGAVANHNDDEYNYYPVSDGRLIFGAQAIDVDDAVTFVLGEVDITSLLGE